MAYQLPPTPSTIPSSPLNNLASLSAIEEKVCPKCKESKPLTGFHARKRKLGPPQPRSHCKQCTNKARVENLHQALDEKRKEVLAFAQKLIWMADAAPDEESARELYAAATRLRLRHCQKEESKRDAVLRILTTWGKDGVSVREIAGDTGLRKDGVQEILDFLESNGLATWFTRAGKRNCGRAGTTRYYRLSSSSATHGQKPSRK
ncbi:MAG TPA: hypothetical protein VGC91_08010 [Pyrinomonadaceae bacterium]|jgi:hypothetical protein